MDSSEKDFSDIEKKFQDATLRFSVLENQNQVLSAKVAELSELLERQNERRQRVERRLALHPVTGIPSHYRLHLELKEILDFADLSGSQTGVKDYFAVVILQIDNSFNMIRKTLKTSIGEWVLYQSGVRIQEQLGPRDRVFHTRENEFIMVIHGEDDPELYESYVKSLITRFNEPHIFSGFNLTLGSSVGVAIYPRDGRDKGDLLHHADIALGVASEQNLPFVFFRREFKDQVIEKMELQNSIIKAIEAPALQEIGQQFEIYYQPKITISKLEGREVIVDSIESESLIRWHHPVKGLISPVKFIPLAEETGLILPLGKWIFFQVLKSVQEWKAQGMTMGASINISSRQFKSGEVIEIMERLVGDSPELASLITMEMTETSLFENPIQALEAVKNFKKLGLKISLDDFGTGYSSLSHLHRFPLDEIKIDQSFIKEFPHNPQDRAIVQSLAGMAKDLKLKAVVEGVEQFSQIPELYDLGCRTIQGYVFSPPMPEDQFIEFVRRIKKNGNRIPFVHENHPF